MVKIHPPEIQSLLFYPVKERTPGQNEIKTSHYNPWTFVFVNLWEQFHRFANYFFVYIAILQAIPQVSSLDPVMGFVGLFFMLGISMAKAGLEDYRRHKADAEINNRLITLWRSSGIHEQIKWIDIQPGDILIIEDDTEFPADCLVIEASSSDKRCRIQTCALDGETDLKYKRNIVDDIDLKNETFCIEMSPPTPSLTVFNGSLILSNSTKYGLSLNNFIPRGCVLKKTKSALVLVVYTGENTKIIMNSSKPQYKSTELDRFLSYFVIYSMIFLVVISVVLTVCSFFYSKRNINNGYLELEEMGNVFYVATVFSWHLVLNNMIPLSLYSSLDIVRFIISFLFSKDNELMDENGRRCICRNSDLVYTIGRITHIFSDKTGTLTKNLMTFKIVGFSNVVLGIDMEQINREKMNETYSFSTIDEERSSTLHKKEKIDEEKLFTFSEDDFQFIRENIDQNEEILFFIYTIVLCNNAITSANPGYYDISVIRSVYPDFEFDYELPPPQVVADFPYTITYLTGSPDELCLLHIARECGYILYDSHGSTVKVIINGELKEFYRPVVFDYSSKRKRGSCIAKIDDRFFMLMKGADSVISEICTNNEDNLFDYVQYTAECGLRTLVYAIKEIDDVSSIIDRYNRIKTMAVGEEEALESLSNEVEIGLKVISFTGVNDELQDDVELTLRRLIMGNIKVWMLTGDKLSTALKIGKTTELISMNDDIVILTYEDCQDHFKKLDDINYEKTVIALEGATFRSFLTDGEVINEFFQYASLCPAVIIARCEPSQKGDVVRSFKKFNKKNYVLAVGDGANDVDMIRCADVGVGVEGKEGSEAVMSSDFSIPSFQYLSSLLLVYGHWCVRRITLLVGMTLYKNLILAVFQIFYGFYNGFSATDTFDSAFITLYNLFFTIPQLFFGCVYEQDLSAKYLLAVPQIYKENQKRGGLTAKTVFYYYVLAVFHSAIVFFCALYINANVVLNYSGVTFDYVIFTQIVGWCVLIMFTCTLITKFRTFTYLHLILYLFSVLVYLLVELIYSCFNQMFHAVVPIIFSAKRAWLTIPLCIGVSLIFDLMATFFTNFCTKPLSNAVAELEYVERNGRVYFSSKFF